MLAQLYAFWYVLVGLAGLSAPMGSGKEFYDSLNKPRFSPPPVVFGIVWSCLYALMGTAAALLQDSNAGDGWSFELTLFVVFLGVSWLFSFAFFSLHNLLLSLVVVVASLGMSVAVVYYFFQAHLVSGWLFLPTCVWVGFAAYLMGSILVSNPSEHSTVTPRASTCGPFAGSIMPETRAIYPVSYQFLRPVKD